MVAQRVTAAERRLATAGDEDRAGDDDGREVTVDAGGSIIDIADQLSCLRDPKCGIDAAAGLDSGDELRRRGVFLGEKQADAHGGDDTADLHDRLSGGCTGSR